MRVDLRAGGDRRSDLLLFLLRFHGFQFWTEKKALRWNSNAGFITRRDLSFADRRHGQAVDVWLLSASRRGDGRTYVSMDVLFMLVEARDVHRRVTMK